MLWTLGENSLLFSAYSFTENAGRGFWGTRRMIKTDSTCKVAGKEWERPTITMFMPLQVSVAL